MMNQPADPFETRLFARAFALGVARILTGYNWHWCYLNEMAPLHLSTAKLRRHTASVHSSVIYYPIGILKILPIESLQSLSFSGSPPTNFCFLLFIWPIRLSHLGPQSPFISILTLVSPCCRLHHSHRRLVTCDLYEFSISYDIHRFPPWVIILCTFRSSHFISAGICQDWVLRRICQSDNSLHASHPTVARAEWRNGIRKWVCPKIWGFPFELCSLWAEARTTKTKCRSALN